MPLNTKGKRLSFDFNRFDRTVGSVRAGMNIFPKQMHRLVMEAVGVQRVSGQLV